VVLLAGCFGAEIEGNQKPIGGQDASTPSPDAASNEADAATPDAPMNPGMTIPAAACMAKGYVTVNGLASLYRVVDNGAAWSTAQAACAADVAGATHLVVLSATAEVQYVKDRGGWVGLYDNDTNVFKNVTNEPNDLRPFSGGQPDNGSGDENCVQMKPDGLDDDQCGNDHSYICECDGRPSVP
jgi:hypothetical protein